MWYWYKVQISGTESRNKPSHLWSVEFWQKSQWNYVEKMVFSTDGARIFGYQMQNNVDSYLLPYAKINSELITDLHVWAKTIKHVEENMGENLDDLGLGRILKTLSTIHKIKY